MMTDATFLITDQNEKVFLPPAPEGLPDLQDIIAEEVLTESVSEEELQRLCDPATQDFKLYRFTAGYVGSRTMPPSEIDYRLLNLHRKEVLERGIRVAVEYYADFYGGDYYEDLIVRETHTYQYMDYRAIPIRRDIVIEWLLNDESIGHTKTMTTYFVGTEGARVHEKRKEANVMNIKAIIFNLFTTHLGQSEGLSRVNILFGYLFQAIETYVKGHEGFLIDAVAAYQEPVFDLPLNTSLGAPTIREYLISELDIPKFIPEAE